MSGSKGGKRGVRRAIEAAQPVQGAPTMSNETQSAIVPFGFELRRDGWYRIPGSDKTPFRFAGPFDVVAESRPAGGDEWGLLLRWKDRDGVRHEWLMPRRLLAGEAIEIRARMAACGLDVGSQLSQRQALVDLLCAVKVPARVRTVSRVGWYQGPAGTRVFVLPDGTVGNTGDEVVRLDLDPTPKVYRARGTLDEWRCEVAARCVENSRLILGVSAAFAGPMLELTNDESGGINFRGGSSKGKTTAIDVAASVWGAPSKTGPDNFTRQWRTTDNALEETLATHTNLDFGAFGGVAGAHSCARMLLAICP